MLFLTFSHAIATLILFLSIYTAIDLFEIKSFLTSLAICIFIFVCCTFLAFSSFLHNIFYGVAVSLINFIFFSETDKTKNNVKSVILSFLFWPQFLCFFAFLLMHSEEIKKSKHFRD